MPVRRSALVPLAVATTAIAAAPAAAAASPVPGAETRSTAAYLRAAIALESAFEHGLPAEQAAGAAVAAQVRASCPDLLAAATEQQLSHGFAKALIESSGVTTVITPLRDPIARYIEATESLSWRSRRLTRGVHARAAEDRAELALAPLQVCAVAGEWKAGGFGPLPAAARKLADLLGGPDSGHALGVKEALALLPGLRSPAVRPLLRRLVPLQRRLEADVLALVFGAEGETETALTGRPVPPPPQPST